MGLGSSKKILKACEGFLWSDKDWPSSAKAEEILTPRHTSQAMMKVGLSNSTISSHLFNILI
jgi:hypothetical protein